MDQLGSTARVHKTRDVHQNQTETPPKPSLHPRTFDRSANTSERLGGDCARKLGKTAEWKGLKDKWDPALGRQFSYDDGVMMLTQNSQSTHKPQNLETSAVWSTMTFRPAARPLRPNDATWHSFSISNTT